MTDQATLDTLITEAEADLRAAIRWAETTDLHAPLALKVRDRERIERAEIELEDLRQLEPESWTMTTKDSRSVATSANEAFDRLLDEATAIASRIATELADGEFPRGLDRGHVGDVAETVRGLRAVSDRMFAEGGHAPDDAA